ncbi:hypothetical protein TSAR_005322 [Trichomalopsis sarcophagae]|uniref:Uncharacterized protein n=1 Tax=Trichomalopsis sarcophagae TaxID=543379 RepID=A0A232F2T8_9HYME|nr:hypothetical protein TSAR_005322 [Trichomalopsis sarcophagae]
MVDIDTRIQKSTAHNIFRQPSHRRPLAPRHRTWPATA